jgi:hypothetical protein
MIKRTFITIAMTLFVFSSMAFADMTLGVLLDKGGKKITKSEWDSLLPVTVYFEWFEGNGEATLTYQSDGTFKGNAKEFDFRTESRSNGTWVMDKNAQKCIDETFQNWPTTFKGCYYYFKLNGQHYVTLSDTDRSSKVKKATITPKK